MKFTSANLTIVLGAALWVLFVFFSGLRFAREAQLHHDLTGSLPKRTYTGPSLGICAHSVSGTERPCERRSAVEEMRLLSAAGVHCVDVDAVVLDDGTLLAAHPADLVMHLNRSAPGGSQDVLRQVQQLRREDVLGPQAFALRAAHKGGTTSTPSLLDDVLIEFAAVVARFGERHPHAKWGNHVRAEPRMFLDLKGKAYSLPVLQRVTALVVRLGLLSHVAVWAMDEAHYNLVADASQSRLQIIWGVMDQSFQDDVSTVPFPPPFPPRVLDRVMMFGISIKAPGSLHRRARAFPDIGLTSWIVDTPTEFLQARDRAASYVITNKPLFLTAFQKGKSIAELQEIRDFCNAAGT